LDPANFALPPRHAGLRLPPSVHAHNKKYFSCSDRMLTLQQRAIAAYLLRLCLFLPGAARFLTAELDWDGSCQSLALPQPAREIGGPE